MPEYEMNKVLFWVWLIGFVIAGCAFEYFWMVGFKRLDRHFNRKQKIITGAILLCVAGAVLTYALFQAY